MARLRLIALATVLAGCHGSSEAPPAPAPAPADIAAANTMPAGWIAQPATATRIAESLRAAGNAVDDAEAWTQPAIGCYATQLGLRGGDMSAAAALVAALGGDTTAKPSPDGLTPFTQGVYHGRIRTHWGAASITVLACFANDHAPAACEATCTALFAGAPA